MTMKTLTRDEIVKHDLWIFDLIVASFVLETVAATIGYTGDAFDIVGKKLRDVESTLNQQRI